MKVKKLAAVIEALEETVAPLDSADVNSELARLREALVRRQSWNTDFLFELIDWQKLTR